MTVYALLCYYDPCTELIGIFSTKAKAVAKAKQMEQANEVEIGNWDVESKKVQ